MIDTRIYEVSAAAMVDLTWTYSLTETETWNQLRFPEGGTGNIRPIQDAILKELT